MGKHSAFSKRLNASGLSAKDVSFLAAVSLKRIREHSQGRLELRADELDRIAQAIKGHRVIWSRQLLPSEAVTVTLKDAAPAEA